MEKAEEVDSGYRLKHDSAGIREVTVKGGHLGRLVYSSRETVLLDEAVCASCLDERLDQAPSRGSCSSLAPVTLEERQPSAEGMRYRQIKLTNALQRALNSRELMASYL